MSEFESYPTSSIYVTGSHWNHLLNHGLEKAASYILRLNGSTFEAINGTTGKVSFDDSDAATVIQDALDALTNGGTIYSKLGNFSNPCSISKSITIKSQINWIGANPYGSFLKLANGVDDSMFKFDVGAGSYYYFCMLNMGLDGNSANNAAGSILDCNANLYDGLIFNCHFQYGKDYDVKLQRGWGWRLLASTFEFGGTANVYVTGDNDLRISDCKFLYSDGEGLYLTGINRVSIIGSWFYRNVKNGLYLNTGIDGINVQSCFFRQNSFGNVNTYDEIVLYNAVDHFKGIGLDISCENTSRYGIYFRNANARFARIVASRITTPATSAIWNSGTDVKVEDVPLPAGAFVGGTGGVLNVRKTGTSTGTGVQQTIAHGLGCTPQGVFLSEKSTGGALPKQTAAADATNIYITATLNMDYNWLVLAG